MKKTILIFLAAFAATAALAVETTLINGPATDFGYPTNLSASVGAGVNTNAATGALTNNVQIGVVAATSTNFYSLSGSLGVQSATNLWPSAGFSPAASYPGTVFGPFRLAEIYTAMTPMGSNATAATVIVRWAASVDGNNWVSNVFVQTYNSAINVTNIVGAPLLTNYDTVAIPFLCIQQIENNLGIPLTNVLIEINGKPGI
jgi:hypothetical protein